MAQCWLPLLPHHSFSLRVVTPGLQIWAGQVWSLSHAASDILFTNGAE